MHDFFSRHGNLFDGSLYGDFSAERVNHSHKNAQQYDIQKGDSGSAAQLFAGKCDVQGLCQGRYKQRCTAGDHESNEQKEREEMCNASENASDLSFRFHFTTALYPSP